MFRIQKAMAVNSLGIQGNYKVGMRKLFGKRWGKRMIDFVPLLVPDEMWVDVGVIKWEDWAWLLTRGLPRNGVQCRHGGEEVNGMPREVWNELVMRDMYKDNLLQIVVQDNTSIPGMVPF